VSDRLKDRTHAKAAKNRKGDESVREWTPHGGSFTNRFETSKRDRPDCRQHRTARHGQRTLGDKTSGKAPDFLRSAGATRRYIRSARACDRLNGDGLARAGERTRSNSRKFAGTEHPDSSWTRSSLREIHQSGNAAWIAGWRRTGTRRSTRDCFRIDPIDGEERNVKALGIDRILSGTMAESPVNPTSNRRVIGGPKRRSAAGPTGPRLASGTRRRRLRKRMAEYKIVISRKKNGIKPI